MLRERLVGMALVALVVCGICRPAYSVSSARDLDTVGAPLRPGMQR
jgi:hypothetical protein